MFSKSQRFANEKKVTPGPGDYDVKRLEGASVPAFPKEPRFSDSSDAECSGASQVLIQQVKSSEFKVPSAKHGQGLKKKTRRKAAAAQTDEPLTSTASKHAEVENIIKDLNELNLTLQSKLDSVEKSFAEEEARLQSRVKCLEAELEEKMKEKDARCEQLNEKLNKMEQELSAAEGKAGEAASAFKDTIDRHEATITELTASLDTQTQLTTSIQAALTKRDGTIATLESSLKQRQQEASEFQQQHTSYREERQQLEEQVRETSTSLSKLTNELGELKSTNEKSCLEREQLLQDKLMAEEKIRQLEMSVKEKDVQVDSLQERLSKVTCIKETLQQKELKIEELKSLNDRLSAKLTEREDLEQQMATLHTHMADMEKERSNLIQQVDKDRLCRETLKAEYSEKVASLQTELSSLHSRMDQKEAETAELTTSLQKERDEAKSECERVQQLYDELVEKVAPFKQQLDAFSMERKALEDQSQSWASEAAKVTEQYAKLLGHQNQKQKIKRINLLSAENLTLKQDLLNSRNAEAKLKRQLVQVQERARELEGKKKGNTGGQKENEHGDNSRSPLKSVPSSNLGRSEMANN